MTPGIYHIDVLASDDLVLNLTITDQAGAPVNLTGSTFAGSIGEVDGVGTVPLTVTVVDAAAGRIDVTATAAVLAPITAAQFSWQAGGPADPDWTYGVTMTTAGRTRTILSGVVRRYKSVV